MGLLRSLRRRLDVRILAIDNAITQYNKFLTINTAPKEIPMLMGSSTFFVELGL